MSVSGTRVRSAFVLLALAAAFATSASAQLGKRFPSEKKIVPDPVTGVPLTFLTSTPAGDSKIYPTHPQWTADGKWLVFRSNRVPGEAMAVNEETGDIVQATEGGYMGMLVNARKSTKLYVMRDPARPPGSGGGGRGGPRGDLQIVEVDLARVFADSAAGRMATKGSYERVVGVVPAAMGAGGDMALDANEDVIYFRAGRDYAAQHVKPGTEMKGVFGPRNMGAGPTAIARMDVRTGEIGHVVTVPFQTGHVRRIRGFRARSSSPGRRVETPRHGRGR
jgi:oligogalacturonide lyase